MSLPADGIEGYIEEKSTNLVLAIEGSKIKMMEKVDTSANQKWTKSAPSEGWFTLKNSGSSEFLMPKPQHASQLWRLNNSKLENGFASTWKFDGKNWTFPVDGIEGCIEDSDDLVLTIEGSDIKLNEKVDSSVNQKWVKSASDAEGWFTVKNPSSNKFLTNTVPEDIDYNDDESITIIADGKDAKSDEGLAQLWRKTDDSKLENGFTYWEFEEKILTLPSKEGIEDYIEDSSGLVLTIEGSKVIFKEKTPHPFTKNG